MSDVRVLDDPTAGAQLAILRDERTDMDHFRVAAQRLGAMLAMEALRGASSTEGKVPTPMGTAPTKHLAMPVVAVPVLRAGLGLLPGVLEVVPDAGIGMVGLKRDEETLIPLEYYRKLPTLAGVHVLVLEPMLATGGSASAALGYLTDASETTLLSVVGTQTAIDRINDEHPTTRIVVGAIDPELNDDAFIVPGLGDFGDRYCGT